MVADPDAITSHMDGLAAGHEACVLVTQIEIGTCRQRALLFKLMFDHLAELREPLLEARPACAAAGWLRRLALSHVPPLDDLRA